MSIIFRLAGNHEYNQGRVPAYNEAIDRHFARFKDHEAVRLARTLRESDGVSFDAVMSMAIHLKDADTLAERIPFDRPGSRLEGRWHGVKARKFLEAARRFAADTRFAEFLKSQQPLYRTTDARLRALVEAIDVSWFDKFFGARPGARFVIIPGLANGPGSYGPSLIAEDGVEESYAILGVWNVDDAGQPVFPKGMVGTLVHEFAHSYVNPVVYRNRAKLKSSAPRIYEPVKEAMRAQAYGEPLTVIHESLVRASTVRYVVAHDGPEVGTRAVAGERSRSFLWTGELSNLLGEYEKDRGKYPTFESFMPRILAYFDGLPQRVPAMVRDFEDSRPTVVSITPPNGATAVDPALDKITVRFSRPMRTYSYSVVMTQKDLFPKIGNKAFDETGTEFTIEVQLEPGREYEFSLNSRSAGAFMAADGISLAPVVVRFRTAPAPR